MGDNEPSDDPGTSGITTGTHKLTMTQTEYNKLITARSLRKKLLRKLHVFQMREVDFDDLDKEDAFVRKEEQLRNAIVGLNAKIKKLEKIVDSNNVEIVFKGTTIEVLDSALTKYLNESKESTVYFRPTDSAAIKELIAQVYKNHRGDCEKTTSPVPVPSSPEFEEYAENVYRKMIYALHDYRRKQGFLHYCEDDTDLNKLEEVLFSDSGSFNIDELIAKIEANEKKHDPLDQEDSESIGSKDDDAKKDDVEEETDNDSKGSTAQPDNEVDDVAQAEAEVFASLSQERKTRSALEHEQEQAADKFLAAYEDNKIDETLNAEVNSIMAKKQGRDGGNSANPNSTVRDGDERLDEDGLRNGLEVDNGSGIAEIVQEILYYLPNQEVIAEEILPPNEENIIEEVIEASDVEILSESENLSGVDEPTYQDGNIPLPVPIDEELEEGEIFSDPEQESSLATPSPENRVVRFKSRIIHSPLEEGEIVSPEPAVECITLSDDSGRSPIFALQSSSSFSSSSDPVIVDEYERIHRPSHINDLNPLLEESSRSLVSSPGPVASMSSSSIEVLYDGPGTCIDDANVSDAAGPSTRHGRGITVEDIEKLNAMNEQHHEYAKSESDSSVEVLEAHIRKPLRILQSEKASYILRWIVETKEATGVVISTSDGQERNDDETDQVADDSPHPKRARLDSPPPNQNGYSIEEPDSI